MNEISLNNIYIMTSVKKRYTIEMKETMPFYKWIDVDKEIIVLEHNNKIKFLIVYALILGENFN